MPAAVWLPPSAGRPDAGPAPGDAASYVDGPPPGHTGGFGEPSCHRCHFDRPVNPPGAGLTVEGLPDAYRPGESYRLTVRVRGRELERGGFQLSVRCARGERAGQQAGSLEASGSRAAVTAGTGAEYRGTEGVAYVQHTRSGTEPTAPGAARWRLRWRAPARRGSEAGGPAARQCGPAAVHVAANAANGDDSEFGDRIYVRSFRVARMDRSSGRASDETGSSR